MNIYKTIVIMLCLSISVGQASSSISKNVTTLTDSRPRVSFKLFNDAATPTESELLSQRLILLQNTVDENNQQLIKDANKIDGLAKKMKSNMDEIRRGLQVIDKKQDSAKVAMSDLKDFIIITEGIAILGLGILFSMRDFSAKVNA